MLSNKQHVIILLYLFRIIKNSLLHNILPFTFAPLKTKTMNTNTLRKFFTLLLFLCTVTLWAQERGSITGTITLSDGKTAENITVALKGSSYSAVSNSQGTYDIKNIVPGNYTIIVSSVGIKTTESAIAVLAGETVTKNFTLAESQEQLNEVVINHSNGRYKAENTSASLRLTTPILEVPQNIQVVTGDMLKDQQITSMSDGVIRNVSGAVRLEHWGDLYTNIVMRGAQVQAFRNGFNVVSSFWGPLTEDMSFVDHIEFVKGPAGFMLSAGDPAGLYNVVTKKPTGQNKGEVNFTMGSFDLYRTTLDLDGKLSEDGRLLYRLNLAAQTEGSHRPFEHNDRYAIAPVVSYQIDDRTKVTAEYNYQRANMTEVGSYYVFGPYNYATTPRDFTLTQPGIPDTKIDDHSAYLMFEHQLDDNWKLTAQASYFKYLQEGYSSWPAFVGPGEFDEDFDGVIDGVLNENQLIRNVAIWDAESTMKLGQAFITGKFATGAVTHKILAGIDMGQKDYMADWGQSHNLDTAASPFDVTDPNYGYPSNGMPVFDRDTPLEERALVAGGLMSSRYSSGYIQDELGFFNDKLRVTVAGRYTYLSQSSWGDPAVSDKHVTPRAGISYSLDANTAFYGLYDQAFVPQSGIIENGDKVKPITGNNWELGIKRDWFDKNWTTTLSAYSILRKNELTDDPNNTPGESYSIVVGERRAQGIEFDLKGRIFQGFNVVANYAFTESIVTEVAPGIDYISEGDVVPGYAKHTANTWLNYTIQAGKLKGLGISGGFSWLAGRETDTWSEGGMKLPDYFRLDGGLSYETGKIRFTANMFNILNEYLYSGSYYSWLNAHYWQSEPPRNVRFGITYKF